MLDFSKILIFFACKEKRETKAHDPRCSYHQIDIYHWIDAAVTKSHSVAEAIASLYGPCRLPAAGREEVVVKWVSESASR